MAERQGPLGLPALLQRGHELVSARVSRSDRPLLYGNRSRLLPFQLDLEVLDSSVFDDQLAQRRLLLQLVCSQGGCSF